VIEVVKTKGAREPSPPREEEQGADPSVALARRILAMRRRRDRLLGDFFAEPAWDILLTVYAEAHEGRNVTVSGLSVATGAPATTALRWINAMARAGLVGRGSDPTDARRVLVTLTPKGGKAIRRLLASLGSGPQPAADTPSTKARKPARTRSLRERCETSPSSSTPSSTRDPATAN
jgi:DNA-binding MarR family transcriptional regulator